MCHLPVKRFKTSDAMLVCDYVYGCMGDVSRCSVFLILKTINSSMVHLPFDKMARVGNNL